MAVVISLNRFLAPVDDTVTAQLQSQVTSHNFDALVIPLTHVLGPKYERVAVSASKYTEV